MRKLPTARRRTRWRDGSRSEEHTSELQSRQYLVCRLLLEKKRNLCQPPFFFKYTATTEIYTLSLHDSLPISLIAHVEDPNTSLPESARAVLGVLISTFKALGEQLEMLDAEIAHRSKADPVALRLKIGRAHV